MKTRNTTLNIGRFFSRKCLVFMWAAALVGGLAVSCHHVEPWDELEGIEVDHTLRQFSDCSDYESYAKQAAIDLMRARVEQAREYDAEWANESDDVMAGADGDADGDSDGDADGSGDHSETNTQEEGVDEADLMKTDGDYIYTLYKGELVIVEAQENGALGQAGRAEVGGYAKELFIHNDVAVVFSHLDSSQVPQELRYDTSMDYYDCWSGWCWGNTTYAQIALVDISDKSSPQVVRTIAYSGEYVTSRRIDNSVRAVIHSYLPALEASWYWDDFDENWGSSVSSVNDHYKDVIDKNTDRFESLTLNDVLPNKLDSIDGAVTPIADCGQILGPRTPSGIGLTTVVSLDLETPAAAASSTSVFGSKGIVYASETGLYLATSRDYIIEAIASGLWNQETSGIHKFDIARSDSAAYYLATGSVEGRLLDQFCMGEYQDHLRVATTTGDGWDQGTLENHVFVLARSGNQLNLTGRLDGLGPGEEIYAARFMGDRGYLVTYYESDPFYTLDMSDPSSPAAIGEWHGPGYSTYLHPVGENSVISVGLEDWRPAVSLYDISDFTSPELVTRLFFPDHEYTTPAVYEHKAFTFNSSTGLLALPYFEWSYNDTGIFLYDVTETGITQTDRLHMNEGDDFYEGTARRSAYIGDYIYGISRCRITSGLIADPGTAVDTVELFNLGSCDDYYSDGYMGSWGD